MSERLSNDQNIANLKKRKILRILIIIFSLITMVLSILSIIIGISFVFPLITFVIVTYLLNKREKTPINKSNNIYEVEKEIENVKKRKK